jgi:hypothetical protein
VDKRDAERKRQKEKIFEVFLRSQRQFTKHVKKYKDCRRTVLSRRESGFSSQERSGGRFFFFLKNSSSYDEFNASFVWKMRKISLYHLNTKYVRKWGVGMDSSCTHSIPT